MKKITHVENGTYKAEEDRYYCTGELLLVIEDATSRPNIGETVNIDGAFYSVSGIIFYPEILIWDIMLV